MVRASNAQLENTKAAEFSQSIKAKIDENKGSKLLDFCDKETVDKGMEYFFYRITPGKEAKDGMNIYDPDYKGDLGDTEKTLAEIKYIYASDILSMADVNSTSLNLKSSFVDSLSNVINRKVDQNIVDHLDAYGGSTAFGTPGKLYEMGDKDLELDSPQLIDDLIEACSFISTVARESEDSEMADVCMLVTPHEYARLNRAEKIGDKFNMAFKGKKGHLFGCKVIKIGNNVKAGWDDSGTDAPNMHGGVGATSSQIYLIPRGTIGVASHENDIESTVWEDMGRDSLCFKIRKSIGTAIIEPQNIVRFRYKLS